MFFWCNPVDYLYTPGIIYSYAYRLIYDVYAGLCVYIFSLFFFVLFSSNNFASQSKDCEKPFGRENAWKSWTESFVPNWALFVSNDAMYQLSCYEGGSRNLESGEVLALGNPCETAEHLQSRSRLGTFEAAESMEVSALGNPCETAEPQQNSGPMGGRLVCSADVVWAPLNPLKTWRVERYWCWATHAKQQSPCRADHV